MAVPLGAGCVAVVVADGSLGAGVALAAVVALGAGWVAVGTGGWVGGTAVAAGVAGVAQAASRVTSKSKTSKGQVFMASPSLELYPGQLRFFKNCLILPFFQKELDSTPILW